MINVIDKETGSSLGTITEEQLKFLIDQLEEEHSEDRDYYLSKATLEMLKDKGIDGTLLQFLQNALGSRDGMEILWKREE